MTHPEFHSDPSIMMSLLQRTEDGILSADLRNLDPPLPMIVVMRLADAMHDDAVVTITLDRDPIFAHQELAEIGWRLALISQQGGVWRFRLEKAR